MSVPTSRQILPETLLGINGPCGGRGVQMDPKFVTEFAVTDVVASAEAKRSQKRGDYFGGALSHPAAPDLTLSS
jgi:hypothetical protein